MRSETQFCHFRRCHQRTFKTFVTGDEILPAKQCHQAPLKQLDDGPLSSNRFQNLESIAQHLIHRYRLPIKMYLHLSETKSAMRQLPFASNRWQQKISIASDSSFHSMNEIVIVLFLRNLQVSGASTEKDKINSFWKVYNSLEDDHVEVMWGSSYLISVMEMNNEVIDCDILRNRNFELGAYANEEVIVATFQVDTTFHEWNVSFFAGELGNYTHTNIETPKFPISLMELPN